MKTVSVIMPAFNASTFIAESIESVIAQTYKSWELLIVDDGSVDNTAAIIQSYAAKYPQIKYFYQPNSGQGKARNTAIQKATGELIAFLDADDEWFPQKLELQLNWMDEVAADLIFTTGYFFNEHGKILPRKFLVPKGRWNAEEMLRLLVIHNRIPILTVLVKKEYVLAAGGFSERKEVQNAEDYNLWMKLCFVNTVFASFDQPLVKYRVHSQQVSHDRRKMTLKKIMALDDLSHNRDCYRACRKKLLVFYTELDLSNTKLIERYFLHSSILKMCVAIYRLRKLRQLFSVNAIRGMRKRNVE